MGGGTGSESWKADRQGEGAGYREPVPLISTDTSNDDSPLLEVSPEERGSTDVSSIQGEGSKRSRKKFTRHFRGTRRYCAGRGVKRKTVVRMFVPKECRRVL